MLTDRPHHSYFPRACSPSSVDYFNLLCVQGFPKLLLLTCLVRTEPICLTFTLLIILPLSSCQFSNINIMSWFISKPALHLHASFPVNCNALKRNYKISSWVIIYNHLVNSPLLKFIMFGQDFLVQLKKMLIMLFYHLAWINLTKLNYVAFLCKIITLWWLERKYYISLFSIFEPTTWSSWFKICSPLEIEEHKIKQ